jgi:hypothetical protein
MGHLIEQLEYDQNTQLFHKNHWLYSGHWLCATIGMWSEYDGT